MATFLLLSKCCPIALTTTFSKILEHDIVLLNRKPMSDYSVHTSDNHFGFKQGHCTLMFVLLLKEVLIFFTVVKAQMCLYVFLMQAKRSVEVVLFRKLMKRNDPIYLLLPLLSWYTCQFGCVMGRCSFGCF